MSMGYFNGMHNEFGKKAQKSKKKTVSRNQGMPAIKTSKKGVKGVLKGDAKKGKADESQETLKKAPAKSSSAAPPTDSYSAPKSNPAKKGAKRRLRLQPHRVD